MEDKISLEPIGYLKIATKVKHQLPSQPFNSKEQKESLWLQLATVELVPGYPFDQALEGLEGFDYIWLISWMHRASSRRGEEAIYYNEKMKVSPPGLGRKVGVFATRSPHHPNPLGLSRVRLIGIQGRVLQIEGCDLLDGTPILDIKPYVFSADSVPKAACGWIDERQASEGECPWQIFYSEQALEGLAKLQEEPYLQKMYIERALRFGPKSSSSNRIKKKDADGKIYELALGPWRVLFSVGERVLQIEQIYSGYKKKEDIADAKTCLIHTPWIL